MRKFLDFWPVLQADAGIRREIRKSSWFWESQLSFRHTRQVLTTEHFRFGTTDPVYGFVQNEGDEPRKLRVEHFNYAGIKAGTGFTLRLTQTSCLIFPLGLQLHLPAFSKAVSFFQDRRYTRKTYRKDEFKYGIYYGLYLRPTYQFSFSEKRSNPWRFNVYAEGDALIHHKSEVNPKFLWGGGLGVSYRLGKAF